MLKLEQIGASPTPPKVPASGSNYRVLKGRVQEILRRPMKPVKSESPRKAPTDDSLGHTPFSRVQAQVTGTIWPGKSWRFSSGALGGAGASSRIGA